MIQKSFYSLKSPAQHWDAIVVGSGMGGMTAAALLAKAGKKVLVLEQHYIPGGFTHVFKRENWVWDVGVHAVGEVTEYSMVGRLLKILSSGNLEWVSLGSPYEQFFFPEDVRIDFPDQPRTFRNELEKTFPEDKAAIAAYFAQVKEVGRGMRSYLLSRMLPFRLGVIYERLFNTTKHFKTTTQSVLDHLTTNERLKTVLSAQWGYYGAAPEQSAFAVQALVTRHFAHGGYYPVGGSQKIAQALLGTVADAGGWTRVRAGVDKIVIQDGKATGVRLQKGEVINADCVISAVGALPTVTRLMPEDAPQVKEWVGRFKTLTPSPCHVCLYIGLEGDIRTADASSANQWFWTTWDSRNQIWDFAASDAPPAILYTSYPSLKDPLHTSNYHTAEVVTFVPYNAFAKWADQRTKKHGEEYELMKESIKRRMLAQLLHYMPKLEPMIKYVELSTPLSTEYYTRAYEGAIYGVKPTPERFTNPWLRPRTPIKNLFLAGSDVGSAGVVGAMLGGVLAAAAAEPLKTFGILRGVSRSRPSVTAR